LEVPPPLKSVVALRAKYMFSCAALQHSNFSNSKWCKNV